MKVLALETSTACGSVAVFADGRLLAFEKSMHLRSHAEFMNPATERCLKIAKIKLSEIDVFACGLGPGSFTGLRVSGNIVKSFAMTFGKPIVAIDSLTLLKEEAQSQGSFSGQSYLCLINAFKNMVYTAQFYDDELILPPKAMTLPEVIKLSEGFSEPVLGLGDGYLVFAKDFPTSFLDRIHRNSALADYPLASTLAKKAAELSIQGQTIDWKLFKPLYIRASAAEENLNL